MNAEETVAFLREHGIQPLPLDNWQPHEPLLYVIEERLRGENGPLMKNFKDKRLIPSVARVDDPARLHLEKPLTDEETPDRVVYELENDGGQVDYFAIDPKTKQIINVKTSARIKNATTTPYHVVKEALFMRADELFPRGEKNLRR